MTLVVSLEHIFTTLEQNSKFSFFCISTGPHEVMGNLQTPCTGWFQWIDFKIFIIYDIVQSSFIFKSGEINSCRLSPLPNSIINTGVKKGPDSPFQFLFNNAYAVSSIIICFVEISTKFINIFLFVARGSWNKVMFETSFTDFKQNHLRVSGILLQHISV